MENSFKNLIDGAKSILILLPNKPFFDQVAAGLSLYLSLRNAKDAQIACESPMTVEFNRLIGVNKISGELGNKNLVIRFTDYQANDIERVSYDIENGQFRLSVIPKDKLTPPSKEQVDLSYSGVAADLVILIGGVSEGHFPMLSGSDLAGTKKAHVGIKDLNFTTQRDVISFAQPASSISELVAKIIEGAGFQIEEDIATNLLMGIEEASNSFEDPSTTADTFEAVAMLMRAGGKRKAVGGVKPHDFPPGAIPGIPPRMMQQPQWQGQSYQAQPPQTTQKPVGQNQDNEEEESGSAPKDWLEPKIFKGTSVK